MEKKISREKKLANEIIILDGYRGCGKTLFGPIISSFPRVEILNYAFEIEFICRLEKFNKVSSDAAEALVKMHIDHKLYQTMMGRETNFRYHDLSSVFNDSNPWRYFKRIFQEGDLAIPDRILKQKPILSLTTHDLLAYSEPVFEGLKNRLTFIEIIRHPLYMLIQETINMQTLFSDTDARDIQINFESHSRELPYFCYGWEDLFMRSNHVERAIYSIHYTMEENQKYRNKIQSSQSKFLSIPFEKFVLNPTDYLDKISKYLNSSVTNKVLKALKKQKVPRQKIAAGLSIPVYKRFGWRPPIEGFSERQELDRRRDYAIQNGASDDAISILDNLSNEYETNYLDDVEL